MQGRFTVDVVVGDERHVFHHNGVANYQKENDVDILLVQNNDGTAAAYYAANVIKVETKARQ